MTTRTRTDTLHKDATMCGQQFLYSRTSTHARVFQLRCRSWTCPKCKPRRQKKLRWQALSGNPVTFLTLTANPARHESPGDAARALTKAWRAARRAIEAEYGGDKAEYLTVVESTQRGWPHLHVLTTRRWIDQRYLSKLWDRLTGAPIVHIERVKQAGSKYDQKLFLSRLFSQEIALFFLGQWN